MRCPMCDLGPEHQQSDPDNQTKSQCKGCGTKFFDRDRTGPSMVEEPK